MAKNDPLTLQWPEQTKVTTTLTLPDGSPLVFESDKRGLLTEVDPQYKADLLGAGYTVVKQPPTEAEPEPEVATPDQPEPAPEAVPMEDQGMGPVDAPAG